MSDLKYQPVKYLADEGEVWVDWDPKIQDDGIWRTSPYRPNKLHAIMFEDGSVFDMVNGWRKNMKYCICCGARKYETN
jgi:hypothetical protein